MDRPALSPYEIMDQIEQEFGLATYPILWPIGDGDRFKGVLDRMNNVVHLFDRGDRKGKAEVEQVHMDDLETLKKNIDDDELFDKLLEDQELLSELISPLDMDRVMSGEQSPLFFGSAMTNFGVQLFLDKFCDMGTRPGGRMAKRNEEVKGKRSKQNEANAAAGDDDDEGDEMISPDHREFSGFVFKTQANLDPKHRDRLAYIRIVSGVFHKGMKVSRHTSLSDIHNGCISRLFFSLMQLSSFEGGAFTFEAWQEVQPRTSADVIRVRSRIRGSCISGRRHWHQQSWQLCHRVCSLFSSSFIIASLRQDCFTRREARYEAMCCYDTTKLIILLLLCFRDTLFSGNEKIAFPGIPSFSPEIFAYIRNRDMDKYKSYQKGIDQLLAEGAVQALRQRNDEGGGPLILAAVGQLQFEVVQARLKSEYGVDSDLEPIGYNLCRWADGGWDAVDKADKDGKLFGIMIVQDRWRRPVLLFRNDWKAASVTEEEKYLLLKPWSKPPMFE